MRRPAMLRSFTCHIGSENDDRLAASESCSSGTRAPRARAVGHREHLDLLRPGCGSLAASTSASFCISSWQTRDKPDAHLRRHRARDARIAPQLGVEVGRDRRAHLLEDRDAQLVDRRRRSLVGGLGLAQRRDRAFERLGERRRVEVAQHRARIVAGAAAEARLARDVDEEAFGRARHRVDLQAPAPRAKLRHRPVELRRRHVAGVELVDQQHVEVLLLDRPLRRVGAGAVQHRRHALDAELGRTQVRAMQLHPLGGNPALEAEHAKLGVGAVVVDETPEEQRRHRLPARDSASAAALPRAPSGTRT